MSGFFDSNFTYPPEGKWTAFNVFDSIILSYTTNLTDTTPLNLYIWSYKENGTTVNDAIPYTNIPKDGPSQLNDLATYGAFDHYPIPVWIEIRYNNTRHNPGVDFTISSVTGVATTTWGLDSVIVSGVTSDMSTISTTQVGSALSTASVPSTTSTTSTRTAPSSATSTNAVDSSDSDNSSSSGLSSGAKAGIGVGVALGAIFVISILVFIFWHRRRRRNAPVPAPPVSDMDKVGGQRAEMDTMNAYTTPAMIITPRELEGTPGRYTQELMPREEQRFELPGS